MLTQAACDHPSHQPLAAEVDCGMAAIPIGPPEVIERYPAQTGETSGYQQQKKPRQDVPRRRQKEKSEYSLCNPGHGAGVMQYFARAGHPEAVGSLIVVRMRQL